MGNCKEAGCLACWLNGKGPVRGHYHHCLSGNKRRGHLFGFCLCPGHHVADFGGQTYKQWKQENGPSLAKESKAFRAAFGDDEFLLLFQSEVIRIFRNEG